MRGAGGRARRWLAGAAALLLALAGCGDAPAGEAGEGGTGSGRRPPVVSVRVLQPETVRDVIELVGQLESAESVVLRSEIEGVVASVAFEEGEAAAEGDVLFRLRDAEQRARLQEAEAQLALARDEFARTRRLADRQAAAAAQLERARAELEQAEARAELARVQLARTRIRAPFDGVTGARLVSPGDRITPETPLGRIEAIGRLKLAFTLPERALPLARVGLPLRLSVAPYPESSFPGEVYFVAPRLNPENRRLLLKAWVPNPEHRLRPGLFAELRVEVDEREGALVVPESAVVSGAEGTYVWRLDAQERAERVPVELGLRLEGRVEVRSGLAAGDRVVVSGTHKVAAGRRVEPSAPAARTAGDGGGGEPEPEEGV